MKKIDLLREELKNGLHHEALCQLYGMDRANAESMAQRYVALLGEFEEHFQEKEVSVFSAPGRTEIGGNHTDHQLGNVIAAAISLDAVAVCARTDDNRITIFQKGYDALRVDLNDLTQREEEINTTHALIRGIAKGFLDRGYKFCGFNAVMTNDVSSGSGLSSSAVIEVLIGTIFSHFANDSAVSDQEVAKIAQFAENVYFGKPCGLMDQMACSVGGLIHIDFSGETKVEKLGEILSFFPYDICITNSRSSHADLSDEYAAIPYEMKAVAQALGKEVLSQVDTQELYARIPELRKQLGDRAVLRALHFVAENQRVYDEFDALKAQDVDAFLRLVKASGDSSFKYLQNVYTNRDVTSQALSVALAMSEVIQQGRGACRVHGGGFAGTIQAFVPKQETERYRAEMDRLFGEGTCQVLRIREAGGTRVF